MITEFKLHKNEIERAKQFIEQHKHPEAYKGTIGGYIDYIFTPTSIGTAVIMECSVCGKKENITDYSIW